MNAHHHIASKDFNKRTLAKLAKLGVFVIGWVSIPHPVQGYCNAERAYALNNNGTHQVRSITEVLGLVG